MAKPDARRRPHVDLLELLEEEHGNFARLLRQFEAQLDLFRQSEVQVPDYGLMRDIMIYLSQYPDQVHHPREDRIVERLARRLEGREGSAELMRHLLQDHEQMAAHAAELVAELGMIDGDAIYSREAVIAKAEAYASHLREHMHEEERTLIPLARKYLTQDDWAALAEAMPQGEDPLAAARIDPAQRALFKRMGPARAL